jgi:hypothetical protein
MGEIVGAGMETSGALDLLSARTLDSGVLFLRYAPASRAAGPG